MPASLSTNEQTIMCRRNRTGALTCMAALLAAVAVTGCSPSYSPNSYASNATQLANKVDQGVVIGVRKVTVTVDGNTGAVAGAAAGGVVGSQMPGSQTASALGAVGGGVGRLSSAVDMDRAGVGRRRDVR